MLQPIILKPALLLGFLLLFTRLAQAQALQPADTGRYTLSGRVADAADHSPIELATVSLLSGGRIIGAATTGLDGRFVLHFPRTENAVLTVSYLGYEPYSASLPAGSDTISIRLKSSARTLNQVEISARKKTVHYKSDRLVYDATADIGNKAGSAADVLRKVPMLTVGSDGDLRMRGNTNIKVLLNGAPSGIIAKNIKDALKMIPASSIRSVEVITSPSAKYEAEGAAGIINIITKKPVAGRNGSIDLGGGNLEQSVNAMYSQSGEHFDFSLNTTANAARQRQVSSLHRTTLLEGIPVGKLVQDNETTEKDRGLYANMGLTFRPDTSHKLSTELSYWYGDWPAQNALYNDYTDRYSRSAYRQSGKQTNAVHYYELSLRYEQQFKRKKQALQMLGQGSYTAERSGYNTVQTDLSGAGLLQEQSPNQGKTLEFNLQADYTQPLDKNGKSILETGLKIKTTDANSRYTVFNNQGAPGSDQLAEVPSRANEMHYYSHILAGYLGLGWEPGANWSFRPGIRLEQTLLGGDFKSTTPSFRSRFTDWVPGILIAKKINDHHDLKLGYTERIRRPWIWDLNPYTNATDPRNLSSGNPQLQPERIRTLEFGHNYAAESGFNLNSSIYFSATGNAIESLTTTDSSGVSRTRPGNIASNKRLGGNVNTSLDLTRNWTANGGLELYYAWFKSEALRLGNRNVFYAFNLNTSYSLPAQYSIQVSGDYGNGFLTLQGRYTAAWSYRFSIQKEFADHKASLVLTVSNPFRTSMPQQYTAADPSFNSITYNHYYNRSVHLSFSWKFGAGKQAEEREDKAAPEMESRSHKRR
ncbi:outer membrane beta-barrel family protein [Taibaiella chishuiensis]|uniref:Outer membrane receptor protein involved in Fe transport n=1 Tax=Taibaiella chishuiensis TaxID=1434707 RepID=A0A2P8D8E1_9BACT|nr:outer membrane beta-barrel family protein [Taibaiella chishuiensis]PSK93500.1 outer membrane receptor protein involved in Fe transport [Taibaiella chishuiensis]